MIRHGLFLALVMLALGLPPGNHGFHLFQGNNNPPLTTGLGSLVSTNTGTNARKVPAVSRRSLFSRGMVGFVGCGGALTTRANPVAAAVVEGPSGEEKGGGAVVEQAKVDAADAAAAPERKRVKEELFSRLASAEGSKDEAALDVLVNQLIEVNPTANPGLEVTMVT
jgi:hypothetical protein